MKNSISILVVDDEPVLRDLLTKILTREGFQVAAAGDGGEALEKMGREGYNVIISDIEMPGPNGLELLTAIKRDYPDTAVIMMTAYGDSYAVKDCLLLGADEYITKPFKSFEIILVVKRAYWRLMSARKPSAAM